VDVRGDDQGSAVVQTTAEALARICIGKFVDLWSSFLGEHRVLVNESRRTESKDGDDGRKRGTEAEVSS
jgi:hypothetical protein